MKKSEKKCFVCNREITPANSNINELVNLRVCWSCSGSDKEKKKVEELLDSLSEGLVCGCI